VLADGRASPPILVNGPFVGAWLPASARRLDLLYRAPGLLAGSLLSALGLAALAALTLRPSAVPPSPR
jgi:hypothetical protein